MEVDPYEEDMEYVILDNGIYHNWIMFFEYNKEGVYDEKVILHANKWDVFMNYK